mgnify:CR=1 FL=1
MTVYLQKCIRIKTLQFGPGRVTDINFITAFQIAPLGLTIKPSNTLFLKDFIIYGISMFYNMGSSSSIYQSGIVTITPTLLNLMRIGMSTSFLVTSILGLAIKKSSSLKLCKISPDG